MSSTAGAIFRPARAARDDSAARQLSAVISLALLGLILGLAVVLVARRLSGSLVSPLSGGGLLLTAIAIESAIVFCRYLLSSTEYSALSSQHLAHWRYLLSPYTILTLIIPGLAAFGILWSLAIRGTPAWAFILTWLLLISAESTPWLLHYRPGLINSRWLPTLRPTVAPRIEIEHPEVPSCLVQQLTRTLEGNRESIHALAKAEIVSNDRLGVVHLSFCPPLAAPPDLSAHALDDEEAEIRITQAETFGVRLEVRLPAAKETPRTVMVEVLGSAPKAI